MLAISAKEVPIPFRLRNLPARDADPGSGLAAPRGSALLEAGARREESGSSTVRLQHRGEELALKKDNLILRAVLWEVP